MFRWLCGKPVKYQDGEWVSVGAPHDPLVGRWCSVRVERKGTMCVYHQVLLRQAGEEDAK